MFVNRKDLGDQLVRQGSVMAWDGFVGRCDDLNYIDLNKQPKDAGLGLWSASPPLERPWDVVESAGGGEPKLLMGISVFGIDQDNRTEVFLAE